MTCVYGSEVDIKLQFETAQRLTVLVARIASGQGQWCGVAQWQRV